MPAAQYTAHLVYGRRQGGGAGGLANAHYFSIKFENYIFKKLPRKAVAREALNPGRGRLFYIDYVFTHRLPSEVLPVVRASPP